MQIHLDIPADTLIRMIEDNANNGTIDVLLRDLKAMRDNAANAIIAQQEAIANHKTGEELQKHYRKTMRLERLQG